MPLLRFVVALSAAGILAGADLHVGTAPLVAHEWGTFTSVAREDGEAVEWAPLLGPGDLPCFVTRSTGNVKALLRGLVRMETPVLYFYTQRPLTVSVHVDFPQGQITEWYPNPPRTAQNAQPEWFSTTKIAWDQVELAPGKDLDYPMTSGSSHYFAARNTDSTPLRIGNEQEKMIFYRGLGFFAPPLQARYETDGTLNLRNTGREPIPFAILFENQSGAMGFRVVESVSGSAAVEAPELNQDLASIRETLVSRLTGLGLYPNEARAMVETWSDSWFTEGSRVLYIVPRATVDSLLPLSIAPAPGEIERVFVGRLEVLSPRTKTTLVHALRAGNSETLTTFGRFLQPFVAQIQRTDKTFVLSSAAETYLRAIASGHAVTGDGYGGAWEISTPAACVK